MSAYIAGGSGSGDTHVGGNISGKKSVGSKVKPAKVVKKAPRKATKEK